MTGKIIKGIAGFYYVATETGIYSCKAKGIFRNQKIKPLVGDNVEIELVSEGEIEGNIIKLLPRKNALIRPAAANVDQVLILLALKQPDPQWIMLDRYLISLMYKDIPVGIIWNKVDLCDLQDECFLAIQSYADAGFPAFSVSALKGEGMEELRKFLAKKTTVLAGPSGAGKSTLTNLLCPQAQMETGELSAKIARGKHTTRHSELFVIDRDTFLCDTPGFTSMLIDEIPKEELKKYYPEFAPFSGHCRFHGCMHDAEPDCVVKEKFQSSLRYANYKKILEELKRVKKYI